MKTTTIIPLKRYEPELADILKRIPKKPEIILAGRIEVNKPANRLKSKKNMKLISLKSSKRSLLMNKAAAIAKGEILIFLHPDTYIEKETFQKIMNLNKKYAGGGLNLSFYPASFLLNAVAFFSNIRMKLFGSIYGDQCIFVRKKIFEKLGGFKELSICEDLEFSQRLKKEGRLAYFDSCRTSSRRFIRNGIISQILTNQLIKILFHLGINDEILRRIYG